MEKDKSRRYTSAADLASDIRRHLKDEPVLARPASAAYQVSTFARRNRAQVIVGAAVFVGLVLGVVVSSWEAMRARAALRTAESGTLPAQTALDRAI
jgi:ferric-dicitrate binding protein FerR (iron transport regulator)